jgi:ABC-type Fe3+ transport system substrate-binding protein
MTTQSRISVQCLAILAALLAACAPAAPAPATAPPKSAATTPAAATAPAAKPSAGLQRLIEGANKEGKVAFADTGKPEIVAELNKRFNQRFGVNVTVELLPLRASEVATRLRQEASAGKLSIDALHPSFTLVSGFGSLGVLESFDWLETFGDGSLQGLRSVVERAPKAFTNQVLEYQHLVYGPAYNTKLISKADVPRKYDDFLDSKWKGRKIIIDPLGNSTYLMFVKIGRERTMEYSTKLLDQEPLFIGGAPTIAEAIARGEAPLGFTTASNVLDLKRAGQPIDLAPLEYFIAIQQLIFVPKGAPHPNAAKLWSAWMATEGGQLSTQLGDPVDRAWPDSGSEIGDTLKTNGSELTVVTEPKDVSEANTILQDIGKLMQTRKR